MDQDNQVTNNTSSLILDDSPSLDWVLARASKLFPKEGDISKTSLVFYQSPANFYAGSAVTQSGFGLSRMGRTRESSICMRDVAAPGMLKFLSQDKGQQLHKDLTHDMMGRTTLHDTRKKFYMEDASHTYRKYKDIRDKCVFYNKDWERVRPESGIFQTEQEMGDVLQALVESIWEREEEEHGRKKRVEGDSPRAEAPLANDDPSIDVTSPVHNGHNGYGEDLGPVMTPGMSPAGGVTPSRERKEEAIYAKKMPCDWLPQYFLSWIFWGPLSSNPDPRISTSTSCDPPKPINKKGEGSQASGGSASRVHSAENFKLKDPSGGVLPADPNGPLPMSRKKARQLKRKEREVKTEVLSPRASLADAIAKSSAQQAEVIAMLGRLNSALTQSMESDRRRQEMDMLREYIAIAEEEGDGDEVQKLRAKRRRLMRESHVGDAAHAPPAARGENGGANGGASSELLDPVHLASRVQPAATVAAVGGGAATMGWENAATMGLVSAEGQAAGMAGAAGGAVGAVPESAEAWRLR